MLVDVDRAREALQACDPDCPRDEWVTLAMAAKAAGVDADTFHQWSAQASSYNERDARSVWNSIKRADGIGPGTLFKTAAQNGWNPRHRERATRPRSTSGAASALEGITRSRTGPSAAQVWERCKPAPADHPYILAKQGNAEGLRVVADSDPLRIAGEPMAGALVVPARSLDGELRTLQFIPSPGARKKLNLPGANMAGVFVVGELAAGATVYLCEGIGQAWACWKATGFPSVVCFGWGRIRAMAAGMRQRDPAARLVMVPDVGKERDAETIAREVKGQVATMPEGWPTNADVNDYAQREGFDHLEALLHSATEPVVDGVVLVSGADLVPQPVSWLWRDWLAQGKLHILAGAPGQGKTTIALAMAATVTIGGRWPDSSRCERGTVLIWSGEDDPADTLLPRLLAAGADKRRVHFVSGTRVNGEVQPFDPATDMVQLAAQAARIGEVRLIVVDPVVSAVTGDSQRTPR